MKHTANGIKANYYERETKKHGTVWDVYFRYDGRQIKLSGYESISAAQKAVKCWTPEYLTFPGDAIKNNMYVWTLKAAFEVYIVNMQSVLAPSTLKAIKSNMEKHVFPVLGNKRINAITPADIRKWQNILWASTDKNGILLKNSTCETIRRQFSGVMGWLADCMGDVVQWDFSNPFDGVKAPKRRDAKTSHAVWDEATFKKFLDCVKADGYKLLFSVMYYSGCRVGEALALGPSDFMFDGKNYTIAITKSAPGERKGYSLTTPPKTMTANRTVALPEFLTPQLKRYLDASGDKQFVFGGERPWCRDMVRKTFTRAIAAAGVPSIRIHDLRHSHASQLLSLGIPLPEVSRRLGHANVGITASTYSHCVNVDETNILAALEGVDRNPKLTENTACIR